ncbi:MAG: metallophosphoesterase [Caulobacterales bacterium]
MTKGPALSLVGVAGRTLLLAFSLLGSACQAGTGGDAASRGADRIWVELTDRGAQARVATAAAQCPAATVDGVSLPMLLRAPAGGDFPVTVCQLTLPASAKSASIEGRALPLPKARPSRLLIFGDTGCRLKGMAVQNCNDPRAWPFALVARRALAHHPDLVIHVGDYWYRETACPPGRSGCAGSPWGDNWTTWDAEFFAPAAPLLAAAPFVVVRGNHEDCQRGGPGWFRLLDAAQQPLTCPAASAPYAVDLGGLNLYVLDSADTQDASAPPAAVAAFGAELDGLKEQLAHQPGWIVTHRPIWGLAPLVRLGPLGPMEAPLNATEQAAVRGRDLSAVQMVVSGHVHDFSTFSFGKDRPAQLVAGTGGDTKETDPAHAMAQRIVGLDGMSASSFAFSRWGFLILDRAGSDWDGAFYDLDDKVLARCRLHGRSLTCTAAGR